MIERNKEHREDQLSTSSSIKSHRKEHLAEAHPDVDPRDTTIFKVRIVKKHFTALSRMLHESILVRKGEGSY